MIEATLFNVSTEDDMYMELRRQMVDDLTADELDQPANVLSAMLQDFVWDMFLVMDDDVLQDMYDNLKQKEHNNWIF